MQLHSIDSFVYNFDRIDFDKYVTHIANIDTSNTVIRSVWNASYRYTLRKCKCHENGCLYGNWWLSTNQMKWRVVCEKCLWCWIALQLAILNWKVYTSGWVQNSTSIYELRNDYICHFWSYHRMAWHNLRWRRCVCVVVVADWWDGDRTNKCHSQITIFVATTTTATAKKQTYATNPVMLTT